MSRNVWRVYTGQGGGGLPSGEVRRAVPAAEHELVGTCTCALTLQPSCAVSAPSPHEQPM